MQIDWWTLGLQTINFLIVVWLLSRFLYRPVRRIIDEREASDRKLAEDAETKAQAAETARRDYEQKQAELAELQRQKEAELHKSIEAERDKVLAEARKKADALLEETRTKLEQERDETLKALKSEITGLATDLARKALSAGASPDAALDEIGAYLDGLPAKELEELRQDVARSSHGVTVTTARAMADDMQAAWRAALSERLGDGVALAFEADPGLLGGAALQLPHARLDVSVAERLRDAARAMDG